MSRAALALLVLLVAGCVPASEELPAAGAAGFDITPSAATSGEPFTTRDGWTVRIERLVVQVSVSASALSLGYGNAEAYVFDAQKPARVFSRALPVGTASVNLSLYGRYIGYTDNDYEDRVERINIDDQTNARFNRLPDEGQDSQYTPGPSVLLALRAERFGQTITLDLALNVTSTSGFGTRGTQVEVREDALATAEISLDAQQFFFGFDAIAASDADGDGRVTASELAATKILDSFETRISGAIVR